MKFKDKYGNVFEDIRKAFPDYCGRQGCLYLCPVWRAVKDRSETCYSWWSSHPAEAARLMGYEVVEDEPVTNRNGSGPCKWCIDEFCTNGDSPMRADYCPVPDTPFVCLYEDRGNETNMDKQKPRAAEKENAVEGMCCDCANGGPCCDWSENARCTDRKEDGSCWMPPYMEKEEPVNQDKPIDQWTLGNIKEHCGRQKRTAERCDGCKIQKQCDKYFGRGGESACPQHWDLTDKPRFTEEEVADARAIMRLCANATHIYKYGFDNITEVSNHSEKGIEVLCTINKLMFPSILLEQSVKLSEIVGGAE